MCTTILHLHYHLYMHEKTYFVPRGKACLYSSVSPWIQGHLVLVDLQWTWSRPHWALALSWPDLGHLCFHATFFSSMDCYCCAGKGLRWKGMKNCPNFGAHKCLPLNWVCACEQLGGKWMPPLPLLPVVAMAIISVTLGNLGFRTANLTLKQDVI